MPITRCSVCGIAAHASETDDRDRCVPCIRAAGEQPVMEGSEPTHCDDYIDDPRAPEALRKYLAWARSPAHGLMQPEPHPKLFANFEGHRVRVVMASCHGDVGITKMLDADYGYTKRVYVGDLCDFSETAGCGTPDQPVMEQRGDHLIEQEEPLEEHGAGPARPRRVKRNIYLKGTR